MKFVLEATDIGGERIRLEFEAEAWPDVLPFFDQFLRGAGFRPPSSELGYGEEESES